MKRVPIDATIEELRVAWHRTKADYDSRRFTDHPHLLSWVNLDTDGWLEELRATLLSGYAPRPSQICWSPKPNSLLRAGSLLEVTDEVVYNLLLGRFLPGIHTSLVEFQGDPDVAYRLAAGPDETSWIRSGFTVWNEWRTRSLAKLDNASYMLVTDITGFYDNVDVQTLASDLRSMGAAESDVGLLVKCLAAWAQPRRKGIPQGYSASDLLAKVYLHVVDRSLRNEGYVHLRYVDDFRVFLNSQRRGREAIARLTALLHYRGLSVQSAKTEVLTKTDARAHVDGITLTILDIRGKLMAEIAETLGVEEDYLAPWEVSEILESREGPPPEVLERAFQECFPTAGDARFDKSLFHYLLNQLGKVGSTIAVGFCLHALRSRPEQTSYILRYFARCELTAEQLDAVTDYMGDALYDYQLYEFVRWFFQRGTRVDKMLAFCRLWVYDRNRPIWLRSYCMAYIGSHGDRSDLENIEAMYPELHTPLERADAIGALGGMELSRRNAFYSGAEVEGGLVARAVAVAKRPRGETSRAGLRSSARVPDRLGRGPVDGPQRPPPSVAPTHPDGQQHGPIR